MYMGKNLDPQKIYQYIVNDFKDAWNSLACNPSAIGRGNFMFALQATILLEFAARLCSTDKSEVALKDLSAELFRIESKYSTRLPGACVSTKDFTLPYKNSKDGDELLWVIFDLVRNGQAHQYQQIKVTLNDGVDFQIALTGAEIGRDLELVSKSPRPDHHLGYLRDPQNDLWLGVCPDLLFLDIDNAITTSKLLERGLKFDYLTRGKKGSNSYYNFDSSDLENCLSLRKHKKIK